MLQIFQDLKASSSPQLGEHKGSTFIRRPAASFKEVFEGRITREQLIAWRDTYQDDVLATVPKNFLGEINEIIDGTYRKGLKQEGTLRWSGGTFSPVKGQLADMPVDIEFKKDCAELWPESHPGVQLSKAFREHGGSGSRLTSVLDTGSRLVMTLEDQGLRVQLQEPRSKLRQIAESAALALMQHRLPKSWRGPEFRIWSRETPQYISVVMLIRNDHWQKRADVYRLPIDGMLS